jgi:hypothetical protein
MIIGIDEALAQTPRRESTRQASIFFLEGKLGEKSGDETMQQVYRRYTNGNIPTIPFGKHSLLAKSPISV